MAILDPLVTSGAVFLVQGAILFTASKTEFAVFSLAYSYVIMGQVLMASLFGAPFITVLTRGHSQDEQRAMGKGFLRLQLGLTVIPALVGVALAILLGLPPMIAIASAAAFVVLSYRDALRSLLVSSLQVAAALRVAIVFAIVCASSLAVIYLTVGRIDARTGLLVLAVSSAIGVSGSILAAATSGATITADARRTLFGMAAWSLPGSIVIWLQGSFYLTIVAISIDLASVGEISASRMLIMPVMIMSSGIMRLLQVRFAGLYRQEGVTSATKLARKIAIIVLVVGTVVSALVFLAASRIPASVVPQAYSEVPTLTGAWALFATANIARGAYSTLYQAMGHYREIFTLNLLTLPPILLGVAFAPAHFGLLAAIIPMALGELALLALLAMRINRQPSGG
ncbi:lipopolysaccharide biosynthesis protein [Qipengyuania sp. RANM35]|uniref:lipopolysaccharide biosynthesis protein n=1 Tax=Qipengyuania sp. RANM35 TaxID=3068635 RepID=UPI0034DB537D